MGQAIAKELWDMLASVTDGDINMLSKIVSITEKISSTDGEQEETLISTSRFMQQASEA